MATPSKEEAILKLILENSPLKEWHFEEIVKSAKVTKVVANKWLKKFVSQGLLKYIKEKGRFPYYTAGNKNYIYYSMKKVYALKKFHNSGLISGLLSLSKAKTIIIFGSMIKGDWYKDSDIDIFVLGDISGFNRKFYELKLQKNIEMHIFRNKAEITEIKSGLIKNIINGYVLKGQIQDFVELS